MKGKIKKKFFTFNALPCICFEKPNYFILITVWKPIWKKYSHQDGYQSDTNPAFYGRSLQKSNLPDAILIFPPGFL